MNIYKILESEVHKIVQQESLADEADLGKIEVTPTRDASHGDAATNAAMVIAAKRKANPKDIAAKLLPLIRVLPGVETAEIAGPGFINLRLKLEVWQQLVVQILESGEHFGTSDMGAGQKVNVEYVSANPTGPMHVGHGRGAVYGDALASLLLKAGYGVTKEYYINDAGAQIDKLAESAHLRYREALGEAIGEIPEGLYPGDYLLPVGQALAKQYGDKFKTAPKEEWLPVIRPFVVEQMMALIRDDLGVIGIHHDTFTSEYEISKAGRVEEAIAELEKRGLIYQGVLEPPKGKTPDDWEPRPQTLFKSSEFGDDCDRPIKKSDGSWTYFAPDIACHWDKVKRGHTKLIDVFGADHGGYVKRIAAAVAALTDKKVPVEVKLCQLVKFMRGGEPLKMSKRAGTFVTVREVVDEVGKDVFRFIMLTRKNDAPLDFDFEKVMEQSKDNPVFYVQYAHARCKSVLRNIAAEMPEALEPKPPVMLAPYLATEAEISLIRTLAMWPRIVETAAIACEPHRVAFYLHDVAAAFHGFWNLGNDEITLRFIVKNDINLTAARALLAKAVITIIASGLRTLGVEPLEEMR